VVSRFGQPTPGQRSTVCGRLCGRPVRPRPSTIEVPVVRGRARPRGSLVARDRRTRR
jgi:hypothetical protein